MKVFLQSNYRKALKTLIVLMIAFFSTGKNAQACWSYFTHTNGCVGDTIWFYPADHYAVYAWNFGDTLSGSSNVAFDSVGYHIYTQPGTYYVTLFTNIGAEWDYYTTTVTIGADCYESNFTWLCSGSLLYSFYDASFGQPNSWQWNFGDPSSGASNTDTSQSPYHTFTAAGNYVVSLISSDGNNTDTTTMTINVAANCLSANISYGIWELCAGDTLTPSVTYTGNVVSYSWNFGDPASGADNTSNLPIPSHIFSSPGVYVITLIISDGNQTFQTLYCINVTECDCWPGDCNRDGEVDGDDLLPMGIYFGGTGAPRSSVSTTWQAQSSPPWNDFATFMYLQDLVPGNHADANGDGTINEMDVAAVIANFGKKNRSRNNMSEMLFVFPTDPWLTFQNPPTQLNEGQLTTMPILLGTVDSAYHIYGFAVVLEYDTNLVQPGTLSANFTGSWLGTAGTDMIVVTKDDMHGNFHIAAVRTDKATKTGKGKIGDLTFQIRNNVLSADDLHLNFRKDSKVITNGMSTWQTNVQVSVPVNLGFADIQIKSTFGVEPISDEKNIQIYPNPAGDFTNVTWKNLNLSEIIISDITGKMVSVRKVNEDQNLRLDLSKLSKGVYFVKASTDKGNYTYRIIKN